METQSPQESAPASTTTPTTPPPESFETLEGVTAFIERRQKELGITDRPPKPIAEAMQAVATRPTKPPPTPEQIAAMELAHTREREQRRKWEQNSRWQQLIARRGERYSLCTLTNFAIYDDRQQPAVERIKAYCESVLGTDTEGCGLVLYGPAGTGKDHLLVAALRYAVFRHNFHPVWVNGMELYGELRDAIGSDRDESSTLEKYIRADILAISDPLPPFGALTEYQAAMLFRIIDARYSRCLPTWATVNVKDGKEGNERMGSQITDRLRHGAVAVDCNWPSFRARAK